MIFKTMLLFSWAFSINWLAPQERVVHQTDPMGKKILSLLKEEGLPVQSIKSFRVYDLGSSCQEMPLYALSFMKWNAQMTEGKSLDFEYQFTGSGGTRVMIFSRDQKSNIKVLFDEVLLDWWGATGKKDCAPIQVQVRKFYQVEGMKTFKTKLRFEKGQYIVAEPGEIVSR